MRQETIDRFWSKVEPAGDGCWNWTGAISVGGSGRGGGYGRLTIDNRGRLAHRVAYELTFGAIPAGLVLDHLCRNRRCVRPDHLEVVSRRENSLRGSAPTVIAFRNGTCKQGHPHTSATTYITPSNGQPRCVICEPHRRPTATRAVA